MNYPHTNRLDQTLLKQNIMGPNPAKLLEELMEHYPLRKDRW